jgi:hypothetical protein
MKKMYNALLGMRRYFLLLTGLLVTLEMGCASEPEVRKSQGQDRHAKRPSTGHWASGDVAGDDNAMGMEMSMGVLDERVVDRAMKPHIRAMSACFSRAGDARKYLSGQVVMRFVVTGSGQVSDVQVIKNGLGSYPVESCLVAEGKRIAFPAPEGRRGTDFEYSMSFQSTGERSVIPWSGEEMARHLYGISSDIVGCGAISATDIDVIAYIEPGGAVGSVGFASEGSLDPRAAICAVALMRKVHVSDAPSSARSSIVLRTTFPLTLAFDRSAGDANRKLSKRSRRH